MESLRPNHSKVTAVILSESKPFGKTSGEVAATPRGLNLRDETDTILSTLGTAELSPGFAFHGHSPGIRNMSLSEEQIRDSEGFARLITTMAHQIAEGRQPRAPLCLVGIRTRGYPVALRLAKLLIPLVGAAVPVGAADITLYRDDLDASQRWPVLRGTAIDFPIDEAEIVLVDDVLFSGRTVRAALNAVCDLGRPARVRLATLVDRGHREFPIQPDFVGLTVTTTRDQSVRVRVAPIDPQDEIVRIGQTKSP